MMLGLLEIAVRLSVWDSSGEPLVIPERKTTCWPDVVSNTMFAKGSSVGALLDGLIVTAKVRVTRFADA